MSAWLNLLGIKWSVYNYGQWGSIHKKKDFSGRHHESISTQAVCGLLSIKHHKSVSKIMRWLKPE